MMDRITKRNSPDTSFLPEDYLQQKAERRTIFISLVLCVLVFAGVIAIGLRSIGFCAGIAHVDEGPGQFVDRMLLIGCIGQRLVQSHGKAVGRLARKPRHFVLFRGLQHLEIEKAHALVWRHQAPGQQAAHQ